MDNGHFLQLLSPEVKTIGVGVVFDYDMECTYTVARFDDIIESGEINNKEVTINRPIDKGSARYFDINF